MNRSRLHGALLGAVLWGLALPLAGCASDPTQGYVAGQLHREDVRTVAVPVWHRGPHVYRRDLEIRLTEALAKRIELDTPYRVTDRGRADTILEGTILAVGQRVLSFNPRTGLPNDVELNMVVRFRWVDLRTGDVLLEMPNFRAAGVYYPPEPLGQDFFLGSTDAINLLAQRIVETLEKPW